MARPPAQPNQSLIDGLEVLKALAGAREPVGSREMGRKLGLEATRVNRLLKTLAHLGIAQQTPAKQYLPGAGMHVLAAQAMHGSGLIRRALGPLESLRSHKLSVALGVLWRDQVCYLYHAGPSTRLADALGHSQLFPATRSSIGLVLLSWMPAADVRALYRGIDSIPGFDSLDSLLAQLADVRRDGFALVHPTENQPTQTLAVAIEHESAAVAMSGVMSPRDIGPLTDALRVASTQISQGTHTRNSNAIAHAD